MAVRANSVRIVAAIVVVAIAAVYFGWYREHARREAFIYHCNEEGAGGMFTSREYCEELYARSAKQH